VNHLFIGVMVYMAHKCQAVYNHYYYYAYVFGKSKQQFAEIIAFHGRLL
jgi:hypothetical protein